MPLWLPTRHNNEGGRRRDAANLMCAYRVHRGSDGSTHGNRSIAQQRKPVVVLGRQPGTDGLVRGGVGCCDGV